MMAPWCVQPVVAQEAQNPQFLYIYKDGAVSQRLPVADVDSITFRINTPKADLLDVSFLDDGSAVDLSPMQMKVQRVGKSQYVSYSSTYQRNMVTFSNPWASSASSYYKVDYEQNQAFRRALADGHTLECLVMPNYAGTISNAECKPFSSHQAGGTGFLVSTTSGSRKNELTFLPNVSTSGSSTWRWATSGIVPEPGRYYHLVGVYDKAARRAKIYVDGTCCGTADASGSFIFPSAGSCWFGIGCDPNGASDGANAWTGNIVLARIYDKPLSDQEVGALWQSVSVLQEYAVPDMVTGIGFMNGLPVVTEGRYTLSGEGFEAGDQLLLSAIDGEPQYTVSITLAETGCSFAVPDGLKSGTYRFTLQRGDRTQDLGCTQLTVARSIPHGMKVIAHRGHWNVAGAAQNSRQSLRNAFAEQCYGSETDVWITRDGHVMVNHDATLNNVRLETASYALCKTLALSNGEKIPELQDFLSLLAEEDSTKLIIEIKTHTDEARGKACCDSVVAMVHRYGLEEKVEYIAFSLNLCKQIVLRDPKAHVAYLNGDKSPQELYNCGVMGLDYTADNYRNHPTWPAEAARLGMTTNVWTIDDTATMIEMSNMGIDYVTTNNPVAAKAVYAYYAENYVPGSEADNPAQCNEAKPNLLDIRFNADGTVEDLSAMQMPVKVFSTDGKTIPVTFDEELQQYVGCFDNAWASAPSTYCRIDYADNYDFRAALSDGHTIECTFCPVFEGALQNKEAKWFSSHQGGGTGFLISTQSGSRKNELTFLPNISTTGTSTWRWATSGIVPESGHWYHMVGVWNREEQKAYIYVNGQLCNTVAAQGSMVFPANVSCWFGLGCDPSGNNGEAACSCRIASARIYDKPLTPEEVEGLW